MRIFIISRFLFQMPQLPGMVKVGEVCVYNIIYIYV